MPGVNQITLHAMLSAREALRYTPAGLPAIECTLDHRSEQHEAGGQRRVECELHAVAFGDVALALRDCAIGSVLRVEGFIARRYRRGTSVALHLTRFERIATTKGI
ncbi:MAG TPA: primosomal replication protein N [Casimicrobiaceae bacterium]|nr:primosomal replication protein N [Casimicrobiaceae bacterium]